MRTCLQSDTQAGLTTGIQSSRTANRHTVDCKLNGTANRANSRRCINRGGVGDGLTEDEDGRAGILRRVTLSCGHGNGRSRLDDLHLRDLAAECSIIASVAVIPSRHAVRTNSQVGQCEVGSRRLAVQRHSCQHGRPVEEFDAPGRQWISIRSGHGCGERDALAVGHVAAGR